MKTLVGCAAFALVMAWFVVPRSTHQLGVADAPPVVVRTVPEAGATNVSPLLKEIKVTFSKKMTDGSWSWSTAPNVGEPFPGTGAPRYLEDGRTCVMPVKLEPGKSYASWLNSANFGNFRDAAGNSAVPYLLVFETKAK